MHGNAAFDRTGLFHPSDTTISRRLFSSDTTLRPFSSLAHSLTNAIKNNNIDAHISQLSSYLSAFLPSFIPYLAVSLVYFYHGTIFRNFLLSLSPCHQ